MTLSTIILGYCSEISHITAATKIHQMRVHLGSFYLGRVVVHVRDTSIVECSSHNAYCNHREGLPLQRQAKNPLYKLGIVHLWKKKALMGVLLECCTPRLWVQETEQ